MKSSFTFKLSKPNKCIDRCNWFIDICVRISSKNFLDNFIADCTKSHKIYVGWYSSYRLCRLSINFSNVISSSNTKSWTPTSIWCAIFDAFGWLLLWVKFKLDFLWLVCYENHCIYNMRLVWFKTMSFKFSDVNKPELLYIYFCLFEVCEWWS